MSDFLLEHLKQLHEEFLGLINQNVDLERWGFIQAYSNVVVDSPLYIIYDSQWCRVQFRYGLVDYGGASHYLRDASVQYGRLHATNDGRYKKTSNGRDAICWHALRYYVLNFLDGLSPQEVADGKGKEPRVIYKFEASSLGWVLPEENRVGRALIELRLHNNIWEYYGQKLFDVFDLRKPELWEKYVQYHNEIKRIKYETWKTKGKNKKPFKQFDDFVPDELW